MIASGLVSFFVSFVVVKTGKWHGKHSHDTSAGPQKFHTVLTPRVGGVGIFLALVIACFFSPKPTVQLLAPMLMAGLPAFAAGLTEDLTKRVGVLSRLLATFMSGILAWLLTGYTLNNTGIWGVDSLLVYLPVSVAFTAFAVAGVANAINMIDGFNGLAGGSLIISFLGLGLIAWKVGDQQLVELCVTMIIVLSGFLLFNFPYGKIFMGDGGAYLLGFLLAWVAVMLPMRNPEVSVWAPMLVCAYPVNEVLFTIGRRSLGSIKIGNADRDHLHSLIKVKIVRPLFGHLSQPIRSSLVSPFCWLYVVLLSSIAVFLFDRSELLIAAWFGSFVLYAITYSVVSRIKVAETKEYAQD